MMATSSSRTRRPSPHSVPIAPILEQQPFANAAKHIQRTRAVDRFLMNEQLAFRTLKSLVRDEMPFSCETDWPETATQTPHARNEKFSAFEMAKTKCRWDEQRLSVLQTHGRKLDKKGKAVKLNLRCVPPEQLALMVQTEPAPMWQDCPHACDSYLLTARAHAPHFASQGPRVTRKTEARKDASPLIIALVSCGRRHEEAMGITLLSIAQHAPNATVLLFVDTPPHIMSCIDLPLHITQYPPASLRMLVSPAATHVLPCDALIGTLLTKSQAASRTRRRRTSRGTPALRERLVLWATQR